MLTLIFLINSVVQFQCYFGVNMTVLFKRLIRYIWRCNHGWFYHILSGIFIASSIYIIWNCESGNIKVSMENNFDWSQYPTLDPCTGDLTYPIDSIGSIYDKGGYHFSYLTPLGRELKEKYLDCSIGAIGLVVIAILFWKLLKKMIYSLFYVSAKAVRNAKNGDQ